jgi:uncharacterized protein (TIGR00369 family)
VSCAEPCEPPRSSSTPEAYAAGVALPLPVMSVDELNEFLAGAFPNAPRGHRVTEVTDLGVVLRMPIGPEHERPGGTVSGPAMMGLADGAAWLATLSRIGPVALTVTSSLTINFLRKPSLDRDLLARADVLKLGRRLSVTDVRLLSGDDLVAQSSVTYAIPG